MTAEEASPERQSCDGSSILVVEDDAVFRSFAVTVLEAEGFAVTAAEDGVEALAILAGRTFDLVICDLQMPNLGGFDFIERARKLGIAAPVLVTTGSTEPDDELRGLKMGAVDFVKKPVRKAVFLVRVQRALGRITPRGRRNPRMVPGRVIGDFRIERKIGAGGMGSVFLARQLSLDREVAVKVLRQEAAVDDDQGLTRFLSEAQAVASLDHPHVVKVLLVGEDPESGAPYFAMEYIEGVTLKERLEAGPMSYREILRVAKAVAGALEAAAARGLIHRDVKPGNIMLDENGGVKILDFGLAKSHLTDSTLTRTGTVIGTPDYFSPEQASGRPLDPRSDLYALGVVMYEMLGGRRPFRADSAAGLVFLHNFGLPRPISRFRKLPRELEKCVLRLLAKDRDERPADAAALCAELSEIEKQLGRAGRLDDQPRGRCVEPLSYEDAETGILSGEFIGARGQVPRRGPIGPWLAGLALVVAALAAWLAGWL